MRKAPGFSFVEAMVSVIVLAIIATITVVSLNHTSQVDQLNTAVRVVEGDLRSLQSQALSAGNVKICPDTGGVPVVCEDSTTGCANPAQCVPTPPPGVGAHFTTGSSVYRMYADVRPTTNDHKYTDAKEVFQSRDLGGAGAPNVVISALSQGSPTDVEFERQNGDMFINGMTTSTLSITLKQTVTNDTRTVSMNALTGRISIE